MMNFKNYLLYRGAADKIPAIARQLVENQGNTQTLDQAKTTLMNTFNQEFAKDPQTALTWLNNLYSKVLPGDYKNFYGQWQQKQKTAPQGQQQDQGRNQQTQQTQTQQTGTAAGQATQQK